MNRFLRAFLYSLFPLLLLVVLPIYVLSRVPIQIMEEVGSIFSIYNFMGVVTSLGAAVTVVIFVKHLLDPKSLSSLLLAVVQSLLIFYLALYVVTLGQPLRFGVVSIRIPLSFSLTITFDYSVVVYLMLAITVLSLLKILIDWYGTKRSVSYSS